MPTSYVVTGSNRGLGLEWVKQLSARKETVVIALIRNKANSTALDAIGASNIHVLEADVTDIKALEAAATETARITGGALDVLINNAAYLNRGAKLLTEYVGKQQELVEELEKQFHVNVTGTILTTNAFLPLLRAGKTKKVVNVASGLGDPDFTLAGGYAQGGPYSISKAALTMANIKYSLELKDEGFIFVALSPGIVDTSVAPPTPEELEQYKAIVARVVKLKPDFTGPMTTEQSVLLQLPLLDGFTQKDNGTFISHHGNKDWL